MQAVPTIRSLSARRDFLDAHRRGRRHLTPAFILQMRSLQEDAPVASKAAASKAATGRREEETAHSDTPSPPAGAAGASIGLGLTASKKIGAAVARNRARRRLRALAHEILPQHGRAGHAYVLVARPPILTRSYQNCAQDLRIALRRVHGRKNAPSRKPSHAG